MINLFKRASAHVDTNYPRHAKAARFIISGGFATVANLGILFVLTHLFHLWYLLSSCVAFLLSFAVSFSLQKFWTWKDHGTDRVHAQAGKYFLVTLVGLGLNTLFMYLLVDKAGLYYIFAQILSAAAIAAFNFIMYQKVIFKKSHVEGPIA